MYVILLQDVINGNYYCEISDLNLIYPLLRKIDQRCFFYLFSKIEQIKNGKSNSQSEMRQPHWQLTLTIC